MNFSKCSTGISWSCKTFKNVFVMPRTCCLHLINKRNYIFVFQIDGAYMTYSHSKRHAESTLTNIQTHSSLSTFFPAIALVDGSSFEDKWTITKIVNYISNYPFNCQIVWFNFFIMRNYRSREIVKFNLYS